MAGRIELRHVLRWAIPKVEQYLFPRLSSLGRSLRMLDKNVIVRKSSGISRISFRGVEQSLKWPLERMAKQMSVRNAFGRLTGADAEISKRYNEYRVRIQGKDFLLCRISTGEEVCEIIGRSELKNTILMNFCFFNSIKIGVECGIEEKGNTPQMETLLHLAQNKLAFGQREIQEAAGCFEGLIKEYFCSRKPGSDYPKIQLDFRIETSENKTMHQIVLRAKIREGVGVVREAVKKIDLVSAASLLVNFHVGRVSDKFPELIVRYPVKSGGLIN